MGVPPSVKIHKRILKMMQFSGHPRMIFYIVTPLQGFIGWPKFVSDIYQDILRTDGDSSISWYILAVIFEEDQRISNYVIVRESTIYTGGSSIYYGHDIGRLIVLIGKGGCGNSCVLDTTITTLLQRHVQSMLNIMLSTTTVKDAYLINMSTIFSPK